MMQRPGRDIRLDRLLIEKKIIFCFIFGEYGFLLSDWARAPPEISRLTPPGTYLTLPHSILIFSGLHSVE